MLFYCNSLAVNLVPNSSNLCILIVVDESRPSCNHSLIKIDLVVLQADNFDRLLQLSILDSGLKTLESLLE